MRTNFTMKLNLHFIVTVENAVNIRNISVRNMYRKLLNIIDALFPMLKYNVPTNVPIKA